MRSLLPIALLALSALSTACVTGPTRDRRLLLTEVGSNEVELYLDEDSSQALVLGDTHKLAVHVDDGSGNDTFTITVLDLDAADMRMQGGSFLVVWEESGYQGPPVAAPFVDGQSHVPGIRVAAGFLSGQRPASGGTYLDDGTLANPGGSSTVQRRFSNGAVVEHDEEGDWIRSSTPSWGAPTP